jgi:hypothetical protein
MSPEERATDASVIIAARRVVSLIRSLFKDSTTTDIYDEALCLFLEHLERYRPMIANHTKDKHRISFTHFVQVNIRWGLLKIIKPREKDAMYRSCNLEFNGDFLSVDPAEMGVNWSPIDLRWVHGDTTGELFKQLSELDRYLIYLKYDEEEKRPLSDYELARITGLDRMYVRRKMLKIRDKLKELVNII